MVIPDWKSIPEQPAFFRGTSSAVQGGLYFEILYRESDEKLVCIPVEAGDEILFAYVHSADKTPVEQLFMVGEDGILYLLEERYQWYGAGLETGSGLDFSFEDGVVRVTGYDRPFPTLPLRVAWTVPQEFFVGDQHILLSDLAPGGTSLVVRIKRS